MCLAASSVFSCFVLVALAAGQPLVPPVKPGLWEARMSALDADGREMPLPEQAALSRMPPEVRARMAETMKARGLSLPDANGATKVLPHERDVRVRQMAADGVRGRLHDQLFHALDYYLEMAFELSRAQVRVGW